MPKTLPTTSEANFFDRLPEELRIKIIEPLGSSDLATLYGKLICKAINCPDVEHHTFGVVHNKIAFFLAYHLGCSKRKAAIPAAPPLFDSFHPNLIHPTDRSRFFQSFGFLPKILKDFLVSGELQKTFAKRIGCSLETEIQPYQDLIEKLGYLYQYFHDFSQCPNNVITRLGIVLQLDLEKATEYYNEDEIKILLQHLHVNPMCVVALLSKSIAFTEIKNAIRQLPALDGASSGALDKLLDLTPQKISILISSPPQLLPHGAEFSHGFSQ